MATIAAGYDVTSHGWAWTIVKQPVRQAVTTTTAVTKVLEQEALAQAEGARVQVYAAPVQHVPKQNVAQRACCRHGSSSWLVGSQAV